MAIRKDFVVKEHLETLSPADEITMQKILRNCLTWGESLFVPKVVQERYTTDTGEEKTFNRVSEGWLTRPWQQEIIETPGLYKVVRVSRRAGKSISLESTVFTPSGPKRMGDIQLGDIVLTPDGSSAPVIGVYPQGELDSYKITFLDGAIVECSLDHLWEITTAPWNRMGKDRRTRFYNTRIKDTRWIIEHLQSNNQTLSIYATKPVEFEERPIPLDAYLLGSILGDGHIGEYGKVTITIGDLQGVELINESLPLGYHLVCDNKMSYHINDIETLKGDKRLRYLTLTTLAMEKLGLQGKHSWDKFIPKDYLYNSIENRIALLQGLMDTDGTVDKIGRLTYTTISEQLKNDVQQLVWSLGGTCSVTTKLPWYTYKREKKQGRLAYNLSIFFDDSIKPFRLNRKLCRLKTRNNRIKRHIVSVELVGKAQMQCITVDHPNHLYITDGFIPTHNSIMCALKALHTAFVLGRGVLIFAPLERQVGELYEAIHAQFLDPHPELFNQDTIKNDTKSPYVIRFTNGGFINFITAGTKSGGKGESARGQGRNVKLIYIDEADYLQDADLDAILAIQIQDPSIEVILTSTPTGKRSKFYNLCTDPPPGWIAFHKTCWETIPNFEQQYETLRKQYSADAFNREFLAEFGEEVTGVFSKLSIDAAIERGKEDYPMLNRSGTAKMTIKYPIYGYAEARRPDDTVYRIVGVDWDKYGAGTQICVIEARRAVINIDMYSRALDQPFDSIKIVLRREIPKSKFTLSEAVKALIKINAEFSPNYYYMDAGYGEHQIETMQVLGLECKDPNDPAYGIHKKIVRVNFSQGVEVIDPLTKMPEKRRIKPEMVNRLVNKFDTGEMILNPYDDEIKLQLENYVVERITASGEPKYTSIDEHMVDALMLGVWGLYTQYGTKIIVSTNKGWVDEPLGEKHSRIQSQVRTFNRTDYLRDLDEVDKDSIEDDMRFAKAGMLQPDQVIKNDGVPGESSLARTESSTYFHRGGRSPIRKGF